MGSCCKTFESCTFTHMYLSGRLLNMFSLKCVFLLTLALYLVYLTDGTEGMGICFGGYPACCSGGKNTCGPFCASCRRVPEFLRNMMMFDMLEDLNRLWKIKICRVSDIP